VGAHLGWIFGVNDVALLGQQKRDGMGNGDNGGNSGGGFVGFAWMGRAMVSESEVIQRVRREKGFGSDHLQCCIRFLL